AAEPRPGGSPRPSGSTSMSMALSSSAIGGRPTPYAGDCARATAAHESVATATIRAGRIPAARAEMPAAFGRRCIPANCVAPPLHMDDMLGRRALLAGRLAALGATPAFRHGLLRPVPIDDSAVRFDFPDLDPVVVVLRIGAAYLDELANGRLRVAGFVGAARSEARLAAVPLPRPAETGMCARQHRRLQFGRHPCVAAVDGDLDAGDHAAAGPGDAGQLVNTGAGQRL